MATFRQMQDRVLDATGRPTNAARGEVASLLNDVYYEVVEQSRLNTKSKTVNLTPTKGDYSLVTDFNITDLVAIRSITANVSGDSLTVPLEPVTQNEILNFRQAMNVASGPYQMYAFEGLDTLLLWPTPVLSDTLTIYYQWRPLAMTQDLDEPEALPAEFHYVIEDGAISRSARSRGPEAGGAQKMAADYQARYAAGMNALRKWRNQRQAALPRTVVVGRRRRPYHRNDVYFSRDS